MFVLLLICVLQKEADLWNEGLQLSLIRGQMIYECSFQEFEVVLWFG